MESANLHNHQQQQQLQDQYLIIQSSPLPTSANNPSSSSSWSSNNLILNTPNTNGINMLNSRDTNTPMNIQDLGFHWGIKDELSSNSNYPKFTDMITGSPSSSIEDLHLHNNNNNNNNNIGNDQRNYNDMLSEKHLLKTFSSGCQINGLHMPTPDFYSNNLNNCSSLAPSRGTFSQIFPSINISNFGQSSSAINSSTMGMNLEALDLFNSPRFSQSFSQTSHDQLGALSYSGIDHLQQLSHCRPSTNPNKTSTFSTTGATEAKRRSSFMEPTKAPQAAPKKSRLDSRATCPPFKVRKEKLGDRIAALQQLVAPFGKTDTASVLMEAIGYIKFLQNQVETLSVPYMKLSRNKTSTRTMQGVGVDDNDEQGGKTNLRSRGLCLVPLSCLSYVTDGGGGVWAPPPEFGGAN